MTRVVLTSPWVPAEWVRAHGLEPSGTWFAEAPAAAPLAAGVCEFAHHTKEAAGRFSDAAFVFSSHCDQLRRAFDALQGSQRDRIFLFNLSATVDTPAATKLYASELERLSRFLVRLCGRHPSKETLREALAHGAGNRAKLLSAAPNLGGRAFMELMGDDARLAGTIGSQDSAPVSGPVRLALLGGPLPRPSWTIMDLAEKLGGQIVLKAAEPGERNLWRDPTVIPADPDSTFEELLGFMIRSYLDHMVDVFQRPNSRLYSWLGERLRERRVKGILLWHYTWCDLWRAEAQTLREAFELPVLALDASSSAGELPRIQTRIEAFMESLR